MSVQCCDMFAIVLGSFGSGFGAGYLLAMIDARRRHR